MTSAAVIATYNGEKYIIELLQSILNQSIKIDEVVICDDLSTDNTRELVNEFINKNGLESSWRLLVNEKNLGYAENYRKGIKSVNGDIIFTADQDDIWEKTRLENMLAVMESSDEIGVLNTDYFEFSDNLEEAIQIVNELSLDNFINLGKVKLNAKNRFLKFPGCVMCFRKDYFESIEKHWFNGWAHDEFLWCVSVLDERCFYANVITLLRRVHEGQTSGKIGRDRFKRIKYLEGELKCVNKLIEIAKEKGVDKKTLKIYQKNEKATALRLELVKERKIFNLFKLLFLLKYYNSKKSYLVEGLMAIKG
ncbi:MAG: glycosyltransferase [Clostridia bacterium]|nr:glycosyltransferase [Clostridia bacterium]